VFLFWTAATLSRQAALCMHWQHRLRSVRDRLSPAVPPTSRPRRAATTTRRRHPPLRSALLRSALPRRIAVSTRFHVLHSSYSAGSAI
jgi:hypothetical protein